MAKTTVPKDEIVAYVNDVLVNGLTKKDSYLKNINGAVKQPSLAVVRLEKSEDYQDIYTSLLSDDTVQLNAKVKVVRKKYVNLVEKNLDLMSDVIDDAKNSGDMNSKAIAVRLTNETIGAMAIVNGPTEPQGPGKLNKANAVI